MNLTIREKELLIMFGCMDRENTHKRLGLARMMVTMLRDRSYIRKPHMYHFY